MTPIEGSCRHCRLRGGFWGDQCSPLRVPSFATTTSLRDTSPQGEAFRLPLMGTVAIAVCGVAFLGATNDRHYEHPHLPPLRHFVTPLLKERLFRLPLRGAVGALPTAGWFFRPMMPLLTLSERKSFTVLLCSLQCCTFVPPQARSSAVGDLIRTHYLLSIFVYSLLCTIDLYAGLIILPQPITSSSLCAHQPTILEIAKSGVYISVGMPSIL